MAVKTKSNAGLVIGAQVILFASLSCLIASICPIPWSLQVWNLPNSATTNTKSNLTWVLSLWDIQSACDCSFEGGGEISDADVRKFYYLCMGFFKPTSGLMSDVRDRLCRNVDGKNRFLPEGVPNEYIELIQIYGVPACRSMGHVHHHSLVLRWITILSAAILLTAFIMSFFLHSTALNNIVVSRVMSGLILIDLVPSVYGLIYYATNAKYIQNVFNPDLGGSPFVSPWNYGLREGYLLFFISVFLSAISILCILLAVGFAPTFAQTGHIKNRFWAFTPIRPMTHQIPQYGTVPQAHHQTHPYIHTHPATRQGHVTTGNYAYPSSPHQM